MGLIAGSGFTTTTFDALFKDEFKDLPTDIMNNRNLLTGMIPKETDQFGRRIIEAIRTGRLTSLGASSPTAVLPAARHPKYANPVLVPKEWNAVARVYENTIERSRTSEAAFKQATAETIRTTIDDAADDFERMFSNDGAGTLTYIGVVTPDNLLDAGGAGADGFICTAATTTFPYTGAGAVQPEDARRFQIDQQLEFWSTDTPAAIQHPLDTGITDGYVTSINLVTGTILIDQDIVPANTTLDTIGGVVTRKGARITTESREFMGLWGIVSAADPRMNGAAATDQVGLNGLTVAANPLWASADLNNGGVLRPITPRLIRQASDAINIRTGKRGARPSHLFMPYGARLELGELASNINRRVNTTALRGKTGIQGYDEEVDNGEFIQFGNILVVPLRYAPQNTAILVTMPEIKFWQITEPHWVDTTGSVMRPSPDRTVSAEAIYRWSGNLCTTNRAAHCRISDVLGDDPA